MVRTPHEHPSAGCFGRRVLSPGLRLTRSVLWTAADANLFDRIFSRSSIPGRNRTRCQLDLPARDPDCACGGNGTGGSTYRNRPPAMRPENWLIVMALTSRRLEQGRRVSAQ